MKFLIFAILFLLPSSPLWADKVTMKDGKVYTGKILVDADKYLIIGNPPFDPDQYLLRVENIANVSYEEYKQDPPSIRRRGIVVDALLGGYSYSSDLLELRPSIGLQANVAFRVHPSMELGTGLLCVPDAEAKEALNITDSMRTRSYKSFTFNKWLFYGRLYPFFAKKEWKLEPFITSGFALSRLYSKGNKDALKGGGWMIGAGAMYPCSTHFFLLGILSYEKLTFSQIDFAGKTGRIRPKVEEDIIIAQAGVSWRP